MSADSSWPLQQAVFTALTGDATLMGMITGAFDAVPQGTGFPYVTIGEATGRDWSAAGVVGIEATLVLHAWSQGNGHQEIKQIMAEVHRVLHDVDLTVSGHALVNLRFEFSETTIEDDGITYHGTTRYRAVTHVP